MEQQIYTIADLMQRYGLSRQGVQKSLDRYKGLINADGLHLQKIKGDWQIDSQGIEILDKARGYNSNVALESELRQARRERELLEEISTLKTAMLKIKEQYQQQQLAYRDKIDELKDRAHSAELFQLQSRTQLEQLQRTAADAQQRAMEAEQIAAHERRRAAEADQKAEFAELNAVKEIASVRAAAATKMEELQAKYNDLTAKNYRLKMSLQEERQKSWLDRLLGR